jgi:hypothetical protein
MLGLRFRGRTAASIVVALCVALVTVVFADSATAASPKTCKIVFHSAQWSIKGAGSGSKYTVSAIGIPCASARVWAVKFTHQKGNGTPGQKLKGPSGMTCTSFATPASGDKLVYTGACHNTKGVSFAWAPKA